MRPHFSEERRVKNQNVIAVGGAFLALASDKVERRQTRPRNGMFRYVVTHLTQVRLLGKAGLLRFMARCGSLGVRPLNGRQRAYLTKIPETDSLIQQMYHSPYHLNKAGVDANTQRIIQLLKAQL